MVQAPTKPLSLEAFLQQPETKPASEFINGQVIQKPMPQGEHSTLQRDLLFAIEMVVKPAGVARAFPELRCTFGGRSLIPDIAVFRTERIPRDENGSISNAFLAAPDWTIEILSPNQSHKKVTNNILHCLDHGCEMGWLLDPEEKSVTVSPRDGRSRYFDNPDDNLPVPAWASDLSLTVGEIFSWLTA